MEVWLSDRQQSIMMQPSATSLNHIAFILLFLNAWVLQEYSRAFSEAKTGAHVKWLVFFFFNPVSPRLHLIMAKYDAH